MRNLFWGITPFVLFVLSFKFVRKSEFKNLWLASLILVLLTIFLSFGPTINITKNFSLPGIYKLLINIPGFENIKIISRFAIFMYFFLGLISALCAAEISKKLIKKDLLLTLLILLTLLEFWNKPFRFGDPFTQSSFYQHLNSQKDINIILEIPLTSSILVLPNIKNQGTDSDYLLYASMFHHKNLINGFSSNYPKSYKEKMQTIMVNFPTEEKLKKVKNWGVDAIILHKDVFMSPRDYDFTKERLLNSGALLRYSTENISLFVLK